MISTFIYVTLMFAQDVLFVPIWLRLTLKLSTSVCSAKLITLIFVVPNEAPILLNLNTKGHVLLSKGKLEESNGQERVRLQLISDKTIGKSPKNLALLIN